MANSDNGRPSSLIYQPNLGPVPESLTHQQVLVAAAAAVHGWEYTVFDPDSGEDGRWRGVDDDHDSED